MRRRLRDLMLAVGFLTVVPVRVTWPEDGAPGVVAWYAWVGWLLGGLAVLLGWLLTVAGAASGTPLLLGGALVVTAWALATRLLHWDALADTADGLWGGHDRERRLEIMRDSRTGSFGVTAIALTALLQSAAAAVLLGRGRPWVLVTAPVLGRAAASVAAWTLPSARREGLGAGVVQRPSAFDVVVCGAAVFGLLVLGHLTAPRVAFFATLGVGVLAGLILPRRLATRVGGMTGDLFGATIVGVETLVMIAGALLP